MLVLSARRFQTSTGAGVCDGGGGANWYVDTENTLIDLFPYMQLNEFDPATNSFKDVLTVPNLLKNPWHGLSVQRNLAWDLFMQRYLLMANSGGCQVQ
jgi:hypothetical protein